MRSSLEFRRRIPSWCLSALLLLLTLLSSKLFLRLSPADAFVVSSRSPTLNFCYHHRRKPSASLLSTRTTAARYSSSSSTSHRRSKSTTLSMHMGHSHTHEHLHPNGVVTADGMTTTTTTNNRQNRRRRIALLVFSAMAILGPPFVRRHALTRGDVVAFVLASTSLTLVETTIRKEIKHAVTRLRQLGQGIRKHSIGMSPFSAKYFFHNDNAADRVTLLGGVINLVLSVGKFAVGVACHSSALVADAGHSLSDLFSDFITLWAVQIGRLPPDEDHPYGHGKFEAIGSLFLALTLFATGLSVGAVSNRKLMEIITAQQGAALATTTAAAQVPTFPALFMAATSIFSKEWLFRITRNVGQELNSQVVIANAWHHRSDAYSSILALGSIALAMFIPGFLAADAAAGILVAGMICMTGAEIMGESIKQLTDTSNQELVERVTAIARQQQDVTEVKRVRARQVGTSAIIDVEVKMEEDLSSSAARAIEERLRARLLDEGGVIDADVKAVSPGVVVCPALLGVTGISQPTAAEVESCVRDEILEKHPEVLAVEGVTVYYQDTVLINVDVDIRIDSSSSVAKASHLADEIRDSLEGSSQINKASIFLDLNEGVTQVA